MIEVIHTPFGQEHPYQQLPEERFPRQPLAGESFVVGFVTRPAGAVKHVTLHQSVDQVALPDVDAARIIDWRPRFEEGVGAEYLDREIKIDQDVWQVSLTAPAVGTVLSYSLETEHGTQTAAFTLRGEAWETGGSVNLQAKAMIVTRAGSTSASPLPGTPPIEKIEWLSDGEHARRVRLTFRCPPDEHFFGLGERYNALDQRGNVMDIRCYEQYKNQGKRAYMPIPFLLSSRGYGVWVESSRWMQFDLAASASDTWGLEADVDDSEALCLSWFTGSDPLEIISQFTQITGPAALPPDWAFGLWMSSNEWNSQARVLDEVKASETNGIPASVVVIEAWSDETTFYIWNDAHYTPKPGAESFRYDDFSFSPDGKWPNPKDMVVWLHEHGQRLVLWQIPMLKVLEQPHPQHEADRAYFEQAGFGVREADGSLHLIRPFWFRGGYLWDVTNPTERDWWLNKRAYLVEDLGIDGFKTDGGEHLWGQETRFADGRRGDELWNEYPQHYTEAYYQLVNRKRAGVTFSRAGFTGSQRSPLHWAGDEASTWAAFRHSILAGLSAGISGIPFWGFDIGGFSGEIPTAELYLRSAAMAAFCPVMQYHSEYNAHREPNRDRTPWNIQERTGDTRVIAFFRFFVNVRLNLMPYIWQEAQHCAATGEPMMRALKLWHAEVSEYAYWFGRDLLVYPVVEADTQTWTVYLPPGKWVDLWTKTAYAGDQSIAVSAPLDRIPVFVRGDAVLPLRLGASGQLGDAVPFALEPTEWFEAGAAP